MPILRIIACILQGVALALYLAIQLGCYGAHLVSVWTQTIEVLGHWLAPIVDVLHHPYVSVALALFVTTTTLHHARECFRHVRERLRSLMRNLSERH